ncbi:MAG TPA: hypothetical protein QF753_13620 [Victivallales bacterium]|nr:hypothetical protein [Victivallales bacterium]
MYHKISKVSVILIVLIFSSTSYSTVLKENEKDNKNTNTKIKYNKTKLIDEAVKAGIKPAVYFGIICHEYKKYYKNNTGIPIDYILDSGLAKNNDITTKENIISINGNNINGLNELKYEVNKLKIGQQVTFKLLNVNTKKERTKTFTITPNYIIPASIYFYKKAEQYFNDKDYDNSVICLDKSLILNKDNYTAESFKKAISLLESKQKPYIKAQKFEDMELNNINVTRCFALSQPSQKAVNILVNFLKIHPDNPLILADISKIYFKDKKYHKALTVLNKALQLEPENPYLLIIKGDFLAERYYTNKKALKYYNKASKLAPNWYIPYFKLGFYYAKKKNSKQAIDMLNKANKLFDSQKTTELIQKIKQSPHIEITDIKVKYNYKKYRSSKDAGLLINFKLIKTKPVEFNKKISVYIAMSFAKTGKPLTSNLGTYKIFGNKAGIKKECSTDSYNRFSIFFPYYALYNILKGKHKLKCSIELYYLEKCFKTKSFNFDFKLD